MYQTVWETGETIDMKKTASAHETMTISRMIKASLEQVFNAWADPKARTLWGSPSKDEALEFIENDFRVDGRDVHLCGQKGDLRFRVETFYHDIQKPSRLLFTERVSTGKNTLCASLITVDFAEAKDGTRIDLMIQVASLVGGDLIAGNRGGWNAALDNLEDFFTT